MAPKPQQVDLQLLSDTVSVLATTVGTLATTVNTLSDRVQAIETTLEKFFGNITKGKWFILGAIGTIIAVAYGVVEAIAKVKGLIKL